MHSYQEAPNANASNEDTFFCWRSYDVNTQAVTEVPVVQSLSGTEFREPSSASRSRRTRDTSDGEAREEADEQVRGTGCPKSIYFKYGFNRDNHIHAYTHSISAAHCSVSNVKPA